MLQLRESQRVEHNLVTEQHHHLQEVTASLCLICKVGIATGLTAQGCNEQCKAHGSVL